MKNKLKNPYIRIFLVAIAISLIYAIPFFSGHIKVGADTTFHLNRVEALATAISNGDFFPRVFFEQNYGYGYGSPMFYSVVYLYPAAFIRLMGVSLTNVYRIYTSLIMFFAALSIMVIAYKMFEKKQMWAVYSVGALYVLNNYALSRVFKRGAIGEILAMIFVPLAVYAVHQILYKAKDEWLLLAFGFAGLLLAHNISFILMVIVFAILILVKIKDVFKKKIYIPIIKGTIMAFMLVLFFILPMLEQMKTGIYFINSSFGQEGAYLQGGTFLDLLNCNGTDDTFITAGIGLALFVLPFIGIIKNKNYRVLAITGYIMLFLTTKYFPWHYVTIINFIQFPSRMIIIALPCLCLVSGFVLSEFENCTKVVKNLSVACLLVSAFMFTKTSYELTFKTWGAINDSTTAKMIKTGDTLYYDEDISFWYNVPEVSSPEYLPVGTYDYYDNSIYPKAYGTSQSYDISYTNYNEKALTLTVDGENLKLIFPLVYYRGYVVEIYQNGNYVETLKTKVDDEGRFVSTTVPENYVGQEVTLIARYGGTIVQKLSLGISFLALVAYVVFIVFEIRKRKTIR